VLEELTGIPQNNWQDVIVDRLDKGYSITDVLLIPNDSHRVAALEIIQGITLYHGTPIPSQNQARKEVFRLMTVDGEPLGKVKVGRRYKDRKGRGFSSRELDRMAMAGKTPDIFQEYPAEFDAESPMAAFLLDRHGYGLFVRRYRRRSGPSRKEMDGHSKPVVPIDMWRLVEVGSIKARMAADELVESSKDSPADNARAVLERALKMSPGHTGASAALETLGSEEAAAKKKR